MYVWRFCLQRLQGGPSIIENILVIRDKYQKQGDTTRVYWYGRISVHDATDDFPIQIDPLCSLVLILDDKYSDQNAQWKSGGHG